jgi:predicted transcriptional regulator of viral defense system
MNAVLKRSVVKHVRRAGLVRPRELERLGVPRAALTGLVRAGVLTREGRGLYAVPGGPVSEHHSLAEAAKRVPHGVVCLLSALRFHGLTVQHPHEVWLAVEGRAWRPVVEHPPLRVFRFTGRAWTEGVERHVVDGVPVAVTSVAKTVADCFKYRNKVGADVAVEALRDAWRRRKLDLDELWRCAEACRVLQVVRPYLEMLT